MPINTDHQLYSRDIAAIRGYLWESLAQQVAALESYQKYEDTTRLANFIKEAAEVVSLEEAAVQMQRTEALILNFTNGLDETAAHGFRRAALSLTNLMAHLNDRAVYTARDNTLRVGEPAVSVKKIVQDMRRAKDASGRTLTEEEIIDRLCQPRVHRVRTQHPTNINSHELIAALGALDDVHETVVTGQKDEAVLQEAIGRLLHVAQIPETNLTVDEETDMTLYFLERAWDMLPETYEVFEEALGFDENTPFDLRRRMVLNVQEGAWGTSGDKDGNRQVTADTTRYGIQRCVETFNRKCEEGLAAIQAAIPEDYTRWNEIDPLLKAIRSVNTDGHITNQPALMNMLDLLARNLEGEAQSRALTLLRQVACFGTTMGRMEYRENAEVFRAVLGKLLPDDSADQHFGTTKAYHDLHTLLRNQGENGLIRVNDPVPMYLSEDDLQQRLQAIHGNNWHLPFAQIMEGYHTLREVILTEILLGRSELSFPALLNDALEAERLDALAILTLDRLALARDNQPVVTDHVIAEAADVSDLLIVHALQDAVGMRAQLHTIPLFEHPEVMQRLDGIMDQIFANPAYFSLMLEYTVQTQDLPAALTQQLRQAVEHIGAGEDHTEVRRHLNRIAREQGYDRGLADIIVQTVQLAHSDNKRRASLPAGSQFIHDAYPRLMDAGERHTIGIEIYDGMSRSDPYRGGMRDMTAHMRQHRLPGLRLTVQGIDNVGMQHPHYNTRFLTQVIAQTADILRNQEGRWATSQERAAHHAYVEAPTSHDQLERVFSPLSREVFTAVFPQYLDAFFNDNPMVPYLLAQALDYEGIRDASRASRSLGRSSGNGETRTLRVDQHKTRTITFSETLRHSGFAPELLGGEYLYALYVDVMGAHLEQDSTLLHTLNQGMHRGMTVAQLAHLQYTYDPAFREIMDRLAFGVVQTDMHKVWSRAQNPPGGAYVNENGEIFECIDARPDVADLPELSQQQKMSILGLVSSLEMTVRNVSELVFAALTGESLPALLQDQLERPLNETPTVILQQAVLDRMPHLKEPLAYGNGMIRVADGLAAGLERTPEIAAMQHATTDMAVFGGHYPAAVNRWHLIDQNQTPAREVS